MKTSLLTFTLLFLAGCGNNTNNKKYSLIGMEFQKFKQIYLLDNYTKINDTIIYQNGIDPIYGILHLRNQENELIIFDSIIYDSSQNRSYKILDTLVIPILNKPKLLTIGYCQIDNNNDENIIAVVTKTDSIKIKHIKKAWRANTASNKIEVVFNLKKINCFNEWY